MTLLLLVALTFSAPGGHAELIRAALPSGQSQGLMVPAMDRAQAEVAVRQTRRHVQDFRGQVSRRASLAGATRVAALPVETLVLAQGPRLLRASLLNLPPPVA